MQTQTQIAKKYGLSVKGHLGQHLLIDPNIQSKIVEQLDLKENDTVLEIGPGLGALTGSILESGCCLTAVEKDARFVEVLRCEFADYLEDGFQVIHADFLKYDLESYFENSNLPKKIKVVSNLPYYVTAPILFRLLDFSDRIEFAVVMLQKEVAKRILAEPGSKDYGRMTVSLRLHSQARALFDVPPACFRPRPEVNSSVIKLEFHSRLDRTKDVDREFLSALVRIAFSQRRKTLLGLLSQSRVIGHSKEQIRVCFDRLGLEEKVRAEELLPKDFLALASALC